MKVSGVVASDGTVVFATRSAFGREKIVNTIRRVDGKIVGVFAAAPKRPYVYNQIADDEIPGLLAQWNERLESRNRERAAASQARWDQFNAALQGVTAALSEVQTVSYTQAFASGLGIAPATGSAAAGSAAAPPPAKPLRFVLDISLATKPGDTVNPTCYSNVITRSGPRDYAVRPTGLGGREIDAVRRYGAGQNNSREFQGTFHRRLPQQRS